MIRTTPAQALALARDNTRGHRMSSSSLMAEVLRQLDAALAAAYLEQTEHARTKQLLEDAARDRAAVVLESQSPWQELRPVLVTPAPVVRPCGDNVPYSRAVVGGYLACVLDEGHQGPCR